ncbi:hypothetical protein Sjap_006008 [Stephania japonica]|uniref:Trigger factor ribosome-binding bacterial domain-containing protein n=1 Tax=Stephania japonica TaxID=461633 RepID=A0AAP0K684_9MAGN
MRTRVRTSLRICHHFVNKSSTEVNLIKKTKIASMAVASITLNLLQFRNPKEMTSICSFFNNAGKSISFEPPKQDFFTSLSYPHGRGAKHVFQPTCAVQTGLKGPVPNFKDIDSTLKDAQVVVESRDDDTIQVRVDLTGWETHKVFDNVLTNLARVAPPLPGFRNKKRKAFHVPNAYIIRAIGKERITKFVVQEIVTSTVTTYVKKASKSESEERVQNSTDGGGTRISV